MASLEVIALDPTIPQLRAPGPGDTYNMARRVSFAEGVQPRIVTVGSAILPLSWNSGQADIILVTGQESELTIAADVGQPIDGQKIIFRIKDNGTARPLSFAQNAPKTFRGVGFDLPVTTIAGKTTYIGCIYNAQDDRWDVIALGTAN
jgi:hypothetical protein